MIAARGLTRAFPVVLLSCGRTGLLPVPGDGFAKGEDASVAEAEVRDARVLDAIDLRDGADRDASPHVDATEPRRDAGSDAAVLREAGFRDAPPATDGRCTETCSGTCTVGGCAVTLAAAERSAIPFGIVVDSSNVYWTVPLRGTVNRVAKGGGSPVTVATLPDEPYNLAANTTQLFWTDSIGATVRGVAKAGGGVLTLATNQGNALSLAADDHDVYWTIDAEPGSVVSVGVGAGALTTLAAGQNQPDGIAVDTTSVYFGGESPMEKVPLGGGTVTALTGGDAGTSAGDEAADHVALDDSSVYWTRSGEFGAVLSVPKRGGSVTTLAHGQNDPGTIAVDATSVYWVVSSAEVTSLLKVPKSGGAITTLAPGQGPPVGLATDETSLYWTSTDGTVMKLTATCACQ